MDIWIVAAAAGAGYIAQQLKNLSRGTQNLSRPLSERSDFLKPETSLSTQQGCDNVCPFRRLLQRKKGKENVYPDKEMAYQGTSMEEMASTSGLDGENQLNWCNYDDCNILSISTLSTGVLSNDKLLGALGGARLNGDNDEKSGELLCPTSFYDSPRKRSVLKTRRTNLQLVKPPSSLESCLMVQLYSEHTELEEYVYRSITSSAMSTTRQFLVTNGNRIISKANSDSGNRIISKANSDYYRVQEKYGLHERIFAVGNESVLGVPRLPNVWSMEFQRQETMGNVNDEGLTRSRKMVNGNHVNSQESSNGALLFCLGISIGMVSSFAENKRELEKLNELLKKNEKLVQDLQEQLEMKDSLIVKELAIEDYESQETHEDTCCHGAPYSFSSFRQHGKIHDKKAEEESFRKIEAELEAELERLELNINSSSLDAKLSDLVELEPDFAPDIVQGELHADMFEREVSAQACTNDDRSDRSTTHSTNYAVSPSELSLRLHEVLQSRLEERVKELETALQNSRGKVRDMESRQTISLGEVDTRCSFINGNPIVTDEKYLIDQPMVINLSGEALDAYNEAYDEFAKMTELEKRNLSSGVRNDNYQEGIYVPDQDIYWIQNDEVNHYKSYNISSNGNVSESLIRQKDCNSSLYDIDANVDEHDEMEKLLIKQILEKTRKGSSVVLNAQRALFSMDE